MLVGLHVFLRPFFLYQLISRTGLFIDCPLVLWFIDVIDADVFLAMAVHVSYSYRLVEQNSGIRSDFNKYYL